MDTPLVIQTTDFNLRILNPEDHPEGVLLLPPGIEVAFHKPEPAWKPSDDVPATSPPEQCGSTEVHPAHLCAGLTTADAAPAPVTTCDARRHRTPFWMPGCDLPPHHVTRHHTAWQDETGETSMEWED